MAYTIIRIVFNILIFIVVVDAVLSYFMSPFHPIRRFLDRVVEPMLTPIRKILPPIQNIDLSPLVLLVILQVLETIILRIV